MIPDEPICLHGRTVREGCIRCAEAQTVPTHRFGGALNCEWWFKRENIKEIPENPQPGDLAYAFKDGRWMVLMAYGELVREVANSSMLWTPPKPVQPPKYNIRWVLKNCLSAEGKVLEVEEKTSAIGTIHG